MVCCLTVHGFVGNQSFAPVALRVYRRGPVMLTQRIGKLCMEGRRGKTSTWDSTFWIALKISQDTSNLVAFPRATIETSPTLQQHFLPPSTLQEHCDPQHNKQRCAPPKPDLCNNMASYCSETYCCALAEGRGALWQLAPRGGHLSTVFCPHVVHHGTSEATAKTSTTSMHPETLPHSSTRTSVPPSGPPPPGGPSTRRALLACFPDQLKATHRRPPEGPLPPMSHATTIVTTTCVATSLVWLVSDHFPWHANSCLSSFPMAVIAAETWSRDQFFRFTPVEEHAHKLKLASYLGS